MNSTRTTYKRIGYLLVAAALIIAAVTFTRAFIYTPESGRDLTANVNSSGVISVTDTKSQNTSYPARLEIPKIGISAKVQQVGVRKDGSMGVPTNYTDVAWYKNGTLPGQTGSAVISGHQDNGLGTPAVFYKLDQLKVGDDVYMVRADGTKLHFKVVETKVYAYNSKEPLNRIFNASNGTYLNLITCAGSWLQSARTNDKRLVVYTQLVS
jgi:LPXTG-site transpeptidase (sortase) family protein